jgi:predicted dehydrogenase
VATGTSSSVKPFRIAFIGTGFIGLHQMKLLRHLPGVEIVAAADISERQLNKVKESHGVERVYTDYKKMLREVTDVDAVSICTPNGLHAENSIYALEAGKHVLVEKPMAMSAREAQRMVDTARRMGRQLVVGYQHRFEPRSKMIHDQIAAGAFGKILYVRAQGLRRRGIPSWGVFGRKDLQGGGPLIDLGVHIVETAHYLMGAPRPVTATGATFCYIGNKPCQVNVPWGPWDHQTYTVEDLAVGTVRFDNGSMMTIESSFAAHIEKDVWNISIMGEKGGANWETGQLFLDQGGYMMNMTAAHVGTWDHFEYKMRHFVEVCRDGRTNEIPPEHALMVQKILDGVYASAEQGREVVIE